MLAFRIVFSLRTSWITLLVLIVLRAGQGYAEPTHFTAPGITVDVKSALAMAGGEKQVYKISLSYSFAGRDTVWLQGIGTVTATGALDYVVQSPVLKFRAAKKGPLLASVAFSFTAVQQGPAMGNPFPPSVIQGNGWQQDAPVLTLPVPAPQAALRVPDVLTHKANPKLSFTPCRPEDEGCVLSQWTTLTGPTEDMQVQVGLMLIYGPAPAPGKGSVVKLFYIGRQALLGASAYSNTLDAASLAKCMNAVRNYKDVLAQNIL